MQEKDLPDWDAFEQELQTLRVGLKDSPSQLLFRGQSDCEHRLTTTLERRGSEMTSFDAYYRLTDRIKPAVETFTDAIWDVPDYSLEIEKSFRDIELMSALPGRFPSLEYYRYMVYLRHHGFPSPLLDWSSSPYVAAFFAFRKPTGKIQKASIYVYCEMPKGSKGWTAGGPTILHMGSYVRSHARHFRQQSDYTVCGLFDKELGWLFYPHELVFSKTNKSDALWKFNLPTAERITILRLLDDYNLNAFSLFGSEEALLETMWIREYVLKA
jgi:hypothetical protein